MRRLDRLDLPEHPGYRTVRRDAMAVEFIREIPAAERFAELERRIAELERRVAALTPPDPPE